MNGKGKWLVVVVGLLFTVLITIGSYWAGQVQQNAFALDAHQKDFIDLLSSDVAQDTEMRLMKKQLDRIEAKVDRLLEK